MQPNPHCSNHMARQICGKSPSSRPGLHDTIPSGKDTSKPARSTKKSRTILSSIHTLRTAEILQQANGGCVEEARATTLCMAWHAQQETTSCATIPTDTGRRGHPSCVCACVVGSTFARVHACLRARARMRRVHVHADSRVGARAQKCMCPHERMRLYMCVGVRGYVHV